MIGNFGIMAENMARKDLTPMEEARGLAERVKAAGYASISEAVGSG